MKGSVRENEIPTASTRPSLLPNHSHLPRHLVSLITPPPKLTTSINHPLPILVVGNLRISRHILVLPTINCLDINSTNFTIPLCPTEFANETLFQTKLWIGPSFASHRTRSRSTLPTQLFDPNQISSISTQLLTSALVHTPPHFLQDRISLWFRIPKRKMKTSFLSRKSDYNHLYQTQEIW